jgi:histone deacetylase 1/2
MIQNKTVGLVSSPKLLNLSSLVEPNGHRSHLVFDLIQSYGLLDKIDIYDVTPCKKEDFWKFHSKDYVEALELEEENPEYNLCDDCYPFPSLFQYLQYMAGSTLTACRILCQTDKSVVINWEGGRHHAKKNKAGGFCWVNDIVLGIFELQKVFKKILYVDMDVHHGDGVEQAFYSTDSVFTVSFHMYGQGLYPGTGDLSDTGKGRGKGFNQNVPLPEGMGDESYFYIFENVVSRIVKSYDPSCIVLVCGADALVGDPLGQFHLSDQCYVNCVNLLASFGTKILVLGGGGYHLTNTARVWTQVTASLLNVEISNEIPEISEYYHEYKDNNFRIGVKTEIKEKIGLRGEIQDLLMRINN